MQFVIIAEPLDAFTAWVEQQRQPATVPTDALAELGQQVFMEANYLYCHTIKSTDATGKLGPDLTHRTSARAVKEAVGRSARLSWLVSGTPE